MGYLSQRKRNERRRLFLQVMTVIAGIYTVLLFFNSADVSFFTLLKNYLFQAYVLTLALAVYAFCLSRWVAGAFFMICFLVQYGYLSASSNIFLNSRIETGTPFVLTGGYTAPITVVPVSEAGQYTVINVNFSKMSFRKRQMAFKKLKEFVAKQDNPVIIYGTFGETPWSRNFKGFMNQTGLQVKNKIKLFDCNSRFAPLTVPTFYVLAFANVGVDDIELVPGKKGACTTAVSKLKIR